MENTRLDKLKSSHAVLLTAVMLVGVFWSSVLFAAIYPYPSRWMNDDMQYLLIAHNITRSGEPYLTLLTERYGGDMENMLQLEKPAPLYRHVLGYHFPSYSYFLAGLLLFVRNDFWAVYIGHTLLYLGIILLTYSFAFSLTSRKVLAFGAAAAVAFSPTLSMYLSITMMEIFVVFLTMLAIFLILRPLSLASNLLLAVVLALLVISRPSFLVLTIPAFFFRFSKTSKSVAASSGLVGLLPIITNYVLGKQGFLYFHEGHHPNTWDDLVQTTLGNWGFLTGYKFSLTGHALYEFYFYVGIVLLVLAGSLFWKKRVYWLLAFTHISILTAVFFRYDWFKWRHIRVAMWFIPLAYGLFFAILASVKSRPLRILGVLAGLLLGATMINANRILLFETLPQERDAMHEAFLEAQVVKSYLDNNIPEAEFVMVPNKFGQAALFDPGRIYYTTVPNPVEEAIPRLHESGIYLDAAFVRRLDYTAVSDPELYGTAVAPWDQTYKVVEESYHDMTIVVNRNLGQKR